MKAPRPFPDLPPCTNPLKLKGPAQMGWKNAGPSLLHQERFCAPQLPDCAVGTMPRVLFICGQIVRNWCKLLGIIGCQTNKDRTNRTFCLLFVCYPTAA